MRETKYHAYLDSEERTILLHSLVELKNQLIQQGRYTDCVDELIVKLFGRRIHHFTLHFQLIAVHIQVQIVKVINAPVKKLKVLA